MIKHVIISFVSAMKWRKTAVNIGLTFLLLWMGVEVANAQFLPERVPLMHVYPFFDKAYIKRHNITGISTQVMYKWPMQKLVFASEKLQFEFDARGNVTKWVQTNKSGNRVTTSYYLSNTGQLMSQQEQSSKKDVMKLFSYNSHGHLTELLITDVKTGKELEKQRFNYEYFTDFQYKKYWLNTDGLTYKYTTVNLDEQNRVIEERTRFVRGAMRESTYYTYSKEVLSTYSYNVKESSRRETKYTMVYGADKTVREMNEYKDGALINHYEYLYENKMLTAILKRNIRSEQIRITKLVYTY